MNECEVALDMVTAGTLDLTPTPVGSLIILADGDDAQTYFVRPERQAWFDWIFTKDPPIPPGKTSVDATGADVPDGLLDALPDGEIELTIGSYTNDKAIFVVCALQELDECDYELPITVTGIFGGMWY